MTCPTEKQNLVLSDNILKAASNLIETQGIISFKFSQLAHEANCSTTTLYKMFNNKEDIIVCLFLRKASSNYLVDFLDQTPNITLRQRTLLPFTFTFELVKRNSSFLTVRSIATNKKVWQLASDEKIMLFKQRVKMFWNSTYESLQLAVSSKELYATEEEILEHCQVINFYLTGFLNELQNQLVPTNFIDNKDIVFKQLSRLYKSYNWKFPLLLEEYTELEALTCNFLDKNYKNTLACNQCKIISQKLK